MIDFKKKIIWFEDYDQGSIEFKFAKVNPEFKRYNIHNGLEVALANYTMGTPKNAVGYDSYIFGYNYGNIEAYGYNSKLI